MIEAISKIWHDLPYVLLAYWQWRTVAFYEMVGFKPGYFGSSYGFTVANVEYRVSFIIRLTWPCLSPASIFCRVAAFTYSAWTIPFKDSWFVLSLIVGRFLMTNSETTSTFFSALVSSTYLDFRLGRFLLRRSLVLTSLLMTTFFFSSAVYCDGVFVQVGININVVDWRHMLLALT